MQTQSPQSRNRPMIAGDTYRNRVVKGKVGEEEVAEILRTHFDLTVEDVDERRDKVEKIDRVVISRSGKARTLQIKYRETGKDILVDVYEPFYGIADMRTTPGRDFVGTCDLYACRVGPTVHLIHGSLLRVVILQTMNEWIKRGTPLLDTFLSVPAKHLCYNVGKITIHKQEDHSNSRPKLLMFIPSEVIPEDHIWTKQIDIQ